MKPRQRRFAWIAAGLAVLGVAVALVLNAFQSNLVFFFSPTHVVANKAPQGRTFRVGGLVEEKSVKREGRRDVRFNVTDTAKTIPVVYTGILPDLFKEGKGVVAQGKLGPDGVFTASEVLAKHDENYMPPEAAEARRPGAHRRDREARRADARQVTRSETSDDPRTRPLRADPRAAARASCRARCRSSARTRRIPAWMALARPAAAGQFLFVLFAVVCLACSFVDNDFSVLNVAHQLQLAAAAPVPHRRDAGARTKARCCCGC